MLDVAQVYISYAHHKWFLFFGRFMSIGWKGTYSKQGQLYQLRQISKNKTDKLEFTNIYVKYQQTQKKTCLKWTYGVL